MKMCCNPLRLLAAWVAILMVGVLPEHVCRAGFGYRPYEGFTQYVNPDGDKGVAIIWNATKTKMKASALLDGVSYPHTVLLQAEKTEMGYVNYQMRGTQLSLGRHKLEVFLRPTSTWEGAVNMTIVVYNLFPVTGLSVSGLDSEGYVYGLVDINANVINFMLTATVTSGSLLNAEWLLNDTMLAYQNYTEGQTSLNYSGRWNTSVPHHVQLVVSNGRNAMNKSLVLAFLRPINGISLRETKVMTKVNRSVTLHLDFASNMTTGFGTVYYSLDWKDNSPVLQNKPFNITPGSSVQYTHTYTHQGNFDVDMTLNGKVESKTFAFRVEIWANLSNLHLNTHPLAGQPGQKFNLTFVNPPTENFRYEIDCGDGKQLTNGDASYSRKYATPRPALECVYSSPGVYTVISKAFNKRYEQNETTTVIVEKPFLVTDFQLAPLKTVIPVPDGLILFTVSLSNPAASASGFCFWNFDSENGKTDREFLDSQQDFPEKESFEYRDSGLFTVNFTCYNNISNISLVASVQTLKWSLTDFAIVINNSQVMDDLTPTTDVLIRTTLLTIDRPPKGLEVNVTYGDDSPAHNFTMHTWETWHRYPRRNIYMGSIVFSYPGKGSITRAFTVRQGAFQISYTPTGGIVEKQTFNFKVGVPGPFTGNIYIYFGDGQSWSKIGINVVASTVYPAAHIYKVVGDYFPTFNGSSSGFNRQFTESSAFSDVVIDVEGAITDLTLTITPERVLYPPGEIMAILKLNRAKHRIRNMLCYIDFNEILDPDLYNWTGKLQPGESFDISYKFLTLGSKFVVANCSDKYSAQNMETYTLTYNPCFSDDAIFDRQYGTYRTPMILLNSMAPRLVTRTFILCSKTLPEFRWWVYEYTQTGREIREVPNIVQPYADYLQLTPGFLDPGLYKLTLNISFGPEQNYIWMQESTFIRFIRAPLISKIVGGTQRLTGNPNALVDGRSLSYDPVKGVPNKQGISFLWDCEILNTTTMDDLIELSSHPFSENLTRDCNDISTEPTPGSRRLKMPDDVAIAAYLFKLRIQKGTDISTATYLFLQYDRGSFNVEVECVVNCDLKVAVTSPMRLETVCESCTDAELLASAYRWNLTMWNNQTQQFHSVEHLNNFFINTGFDTGPGINIPEGKLEGCKRYLIYGKMTLPTGRDSIACYEFVTNCIPEGGDCDVTPNAGNVMVQKFSLNCSGWVDDGFTDPTNKSEISDTSGELEEATHSLYYKFYLHRKSIFIPIAEGGESNMPRLELPMIVGEDGEDYFLVVRIFDTLGDYAEVSLPITLYMTNVENQDEISNTTEFWNGQMFYTNYSSTVDKMLRSVSTMTSIMATFPIPDVRNDLYKASTSDKKTVVRQNWSSLWHDLNNPPSNPIRTNMTTLTQQFSTMIQGRKRESEGLTGMGVAALGEGIAAILFNAKVVDTESVLASSDAAESGSEAVKRLFNTKPFPIGARLNDAAFSMCGLLDRLLAASVPTYDLSVGANMVINSSDFGEDVGRFMVSRVVLAAAVVERRKIITTHTAMPKLITTINTLQDSLMIQQVLGQPPTRVHRGGVTLAAVKVSGRTLGATNITVSDFDLNMDSIDDDDSESDPDKVVDVKACVLTKNPYAWSKDGSSYEITSPVVRVNLTDKKGQRKLRKLTMKLKRGTTSPVPQMETYSSDASRGGPDGWWYHHFSLRSGSASVVIFFSLPEGLSEVVAYFRSGRWPTKERYDVRKEREKVSDESLSRRRRAAVQNATTPAPNITFKGPIYKFFVPPGYLSPGRAFVGFQLPELGEDDNITRHYNYMGFSDTCRVWDDERETWDPSACSVSGQSDAHVTVCECENPPGLTFASSFFLAPTTIDFSSVFAKFDITNAAVYGTLIGLALVWVLALLWARRKDRRDKERWLVGYLKDNLVDDGYFYLVTVHTGIRRGAGTLSNVKFILTGQLGDTGVRVLSDGKRTLETGSMMCYILATTQRLGDLRHLRVWHDDSGPMGKSAWYLSRMTADDLQTGERFIFICEKWLALDKDEGLIDRVVPVTMKDEVMTFDKLFSEHARLGVTDTHLWLSCLLRPERSAFTRKQRVSCCLALLLLTMITSAMFYQPEDSETGESTNKMGMEVTVGIMKFSMTTLWTSFVSIAITSVPIIIFVALFRSCRPRWGPRAEAQKHRRMGLLQMTKSSKRISEKGKGVGQGKEKEEEKEDQNMSDLLDDAFQKNPLPHLCVYLTWLLLLGSMAACAFFLMLYSMQWGKTTSEEWLASFFLSFFESIFVVDPIKVLLLACLLAYCAGNPYFSTQHQHVDLQRVHTEAETFGSDQIDPTAVPPDPIPDSVLEAARKRREQEQLAQRVFFELVLYSLYVFCVFAVSYGHRDQNTYHLNSHLSNLFYARDGNAPMPFESISTRKDVMTFINQTIREVAFPLTDMTGQELNWKLKYFSSDLSSFRVGPVRVRQVRMPKREKYPKVTRMYPSLSVNSESFPPYHMEAEETGSYCLGWKARGCTDAELTTKLTLSSWKYEANVTDVPVWGIFAFYPSGGYLVDFVINRAVVSNMIEELYENTWLDLQTKAVFVEMVLYNPNNNLFTFLRMATEFPEVGSNIIWKDSKTLRIYNHLGALGAFNLICELSLVLVVLIFTFKFIIKIKTQKCAYLKDFWQVLDLLSLIISYAGIVTYVVKSLKVDEVMAAWRYNPKAYVDFYLPLLYDDIYGLILAALVFVVTIRLLRVLGYNKRITMIATVLSRSGSDLFGFFVVFFIVLTAYMMAGLILFAATMYQFRSVWDSYCTLYLVLLGKNVLGRFIGEAPLWAQAYYCSLTILVVFILYTMFQAILCNTTSIVRADIATVPPPYGLVNVLEKFYRATIADWVPAWFVKTPKTVAPETMAPSASAAAGVKAGWIYPVARMPHYQQDVRTQPHRVLATLSDHFSRFYQGEETKAARRKRKMAFTNISKEKTAGNKETGF